MEASQGCTLGDEGPHEWGFPQWRARVSYVSQNRPCVTGTPRELFVAASALASQRHQRRHRRQRRGCPGGLDDALASVSFLDDVASRLGLDAAGCLDRAWSSLSGGEAQRSLLAVHAATRPDVLLLDEPTAACDPTSTALVEEVLVGLGCGILWVSHDPAQARRVGGAVYRFPPPPGAIP